MVSAILREIELRKNYLDTDQLDTVYFGGGTPSVLEPGQLERLFESIEQHFTLSDTVEYTIETNPDDLGSYFLSWLSDSPVNRLSIGVQSFSDSDLQWMNRAHDARRAYDCIRTARACGFENLNIDLIYGLPGQSEKLWELQLDRFIELELPHLSAYCLTVEDRTALAHSVRTGKVSVPTDEQSAAQFEYLMDRMEKAGYRHYEISNFCLPGNVSRHNSSYWKGQPYLGCGPSAHSFDGKSRCWNASANMRYMKTIESGELPIETEQLSEKDRFNEYILTGLRTDWGVSLKPLERQFGTARQTELLKSAAPWIQSGHILETSGEDSGLYLNRSGKLLADQIIASLFGE